MPADSHGMSFGFSMGWIVKIAVAQTRPMVGPVESNLAGHLSLIELAAQQGVGFLTFPELSLTGYEPRLAHAFARLVSDPCFDEMQSAADRNRMTIIAGAPIVGDLRPRIGALIFRPEKERQCYSKQYLHPDEEKYFEPGPDAPCLLDGSPAIAIAICYELTESRHHQKALEGGASIYMASVAKSIAVETACLQLSHLAKAHGMVVMMANCLGLLDGMECVGKSSVWNSQGDLIGQLDNAQEGILVFDFPNAVKAIEARLPGPANR